MARRVKAQTINQIATKSIANKDDKILVSSTDGVVNSIELNKLSGLFGSGDGSGSGSGSGSSGGSGSGSGSSGSGIINVELNTLNSTTFYARKFEVNSKSCDTDGCIRSDHITIDEDSSIYASVYIQSTNLSAGQFGIEFEDASGNWFPVKTSHTIANTAHGYEGSTEISFKAYSGCKLRAFIKNGTTQFTTTDGIELIMYATAIKGSKWQKNSRTLTLTISQTNKENGLYVSNPISFRHEGGSANFPEGYEGAMVSVTGYFSLHSTTKATVEETTNHTVHLQYKPKDSTTWTNLTTVIVPTTKQFCNFGTFFIERDSELRLASSHQPTTTSINSPYFGCTGIIQYTAVNRKTDGDTGTDTEENATLSVLSDISSDMNDNPEAVTKFNFNIPTYASGTTDASQLATLRFNNFKFESNNAVIAWDPGIVQQISEDGIFWHQYGHGITTCSGSSHSISATQLTSLGISTAGTALKFNLAINYGSITKGKTINGLTDVIIGTTVKNIDDYCFSDLSGLTSITIPQTCQTIGGNYTFATTISKLPSKLENITFAGTETSVATGELNHTFENLSALTSLNLQKLKNVTKIKESTFTNCNGLTSINIPNGCKDLDWKAFNKTPNLSTIIVPASISAITNPTNRINDSGWYVKTIGIKLSGDAESYDINKKDGEIKVKEEVEGIRNILSTINDLKPTAPNFVYAVILDNNGQFITTDGGYLLAFDCSKPDDSGVKNPHRSDFDGRF